MSEFSDNLPLQGEKGQRKKCQIPNVWYMKCHKSVIVRHTETRYLCKRKFTQKH